MHTGMVGGVPCVCVACESLTVAPLCRMPALAFAFAFAKTAFIPRPSCGQATYIQHTITHHTRRATHLRHRFRFDGLGIMVVMRRLAAGIAAGAGALGTVDRGDKKLQAVSEGEAFQ
jgi:hypothetical protein